MSDAERRPLGSPSLKRTTRASVAPSMSSSFVLRTPRLLLRSFRADDAVPFHAYRTDPEVARYQGWTAPTQEEAAAFVARQEQVVPGTPGTGAQIAIELQASGDMIGDVFLHTPREEPEHARIGFTLARPFQAQGLATEAVRRLLAFTFDDLAKHRVTALVLAANARSIALLERVGMRREAHHVQSTRFENAWADEYVYALLRAEWEQAARHPGT